MENKQQIKRKGRSRVIIDIDDIQILKILTEEKQKGLGLDILKEKLNISHNGLLVHLRRLESLNLINIGRLNENYKIKVVRITNMVEQILNVIKENK